MGLAYSYVFWTCLILNIIILSISNINVRYAHLREQQTNVIILWNKLGSLFFQNKLR